MLGSAGAGERRAQHLVHLLALLQSAGADLWRDRLHDRHRPVERRLRHGRAAAGAAAVPRRVRGGPAGGDHQGALIDPTPLARHGAMLGCHAPTEYARLNDTLDRGLLQGTACNGQM